MKMSHTVDVVEQCRISAPPGSVSPVSLPLTYFDIEWLVQHSVHILFFYEFRRSRTEFTDTVLPNLKHSLSLTLQHFFPYAGTLTWPDDSIKPVICCTEADSVSFTVAESGYDFHKLSGNQPRDVNLFYPLVPQLPDSSDLKFFPLLALQVTLFPNKGICIGFQFNHTVGDGRSFFHFMKSWASFSRNGNTFEPLPCLDRNLVKDLNGMVTGLLNAFTITKESFHVSNKHIFPIQDMVLATFVIRPRDFEIMRRWISARFENRNEAPLYLSTYVLASAFVWVCLVKLRQSEATLKTTDGPIFEYFGVTIDCRTRRKPPLPTFYFGNCLGADIIKATRSELAGEDGIVVAVRLIENLIRKGDNGDETLISVEASNDLWVESGILGVAASSKFGAYDTDFGWGHPKKVEVSSIATAGALSLLEHPDEIGAVEVGLARSKTEMDAFTSVFVDDLKAFDLKLRKCNL